MKLDKLVGERFKEKPSDCVVEKSCTDDARRLYERCSQGNLLTIYPIKAHLPENRGDYP